MASCSKAWHQALSACERASGISQVDFADNARREKLCAVSECQDFFNTAHNLRTGGCLKTVDESYPSIAWAEVYCAALTETNGRRMLVSGVSEASGNASETVALSDSSAVDSIASRLTSMKHAARYLFPGPHDTDNDEDPKRTSPPTTPPIILLPDVIVVGDTPATTAPAATTAATTTPATTTPAATTPATTTPATTTPATTTPATVTPATTTPAATTTPTTTSPVITTPPFIPDAPTTSMTPPPIPVTPQTAAPAPIPPPFITPSPAPLPIPPPSIATSSPETTTSSVAPTVSIESESGSLGSMSSSSSMASSGSMDLSLKPGNDVMALPDAQTPLTTVIAPAVTRTSTLPAKSESESGLSSTTLAVGGGGAGVFLLVLVLLVAAWVRGKRRRCVKQDQLVESPKDLDEYLGDFTSTAATTSDPASPTTWSTASDLREVKSIPLSEIKFDDARGAASVSSTVVFGFYKNSKVAVKKLFVATTAPQTHAQARKAETQIAITASLKHPRIVTFLGWTCKNDIEFMIVSEYMAGGDLRTHLDVQAQQGYPTGFSDEKIWIALHIAQALAFLHDHRPAFVRRTTTSHDVLLTENSMAKLHNFSVPSQHDQLMDPRHYAYRWSAPEILRQDKVDKKVDIFSFGAILSELDTYELPYELETNQMSDDVLLGKIMRGQIRPRFSQDANKEMQQLAMECLCHQPASRPTAHRVVERIRSRLQLDRPIASAKSGHGGRK